MAFMERRSKEQRSYNIVGTTSSYFFIIYATFLPHKYVYVAFKLLFLWKQELQHCETDPVKAKRRDSRLSSPDVISAKV